jgi:transcriptional regulator with XRE-family HTH domain
MAPIIYESVYLSNANVFDLENNPPYIGCMTILRKNLKQEMNSRGWNATVLSERSGVPQPTIQRFLSGTHGDPRSSTIQKLAKGLGTTEAALRGFEEAEAPIPLYENIEKLNEENRKLIEQMVSTLVKAQPEFAPKSSENKSNKPLTPRPENVGGGGVNQPYTLASYRRRQGDGPASKEFIEAVQHDWEDHERSK